MSQTKAQLVGGVGFSTADSLTVHNGLAVTGVVTATSFSGDGSSLAGVANTDFINAEQVTVVGVVTATSAALTGNISAASGTFTGNVTVGGTLTYDDVTNVDSIGVVTARGGVKTNVSPAVTIRDGTTEKGYIGFNGNDPFIGRKSGVGVAFQNNKIRPVDGDDGSASNNTVDIGESTYKFKDGYFAGTVTAGGIDASGLLQEKVNITAGKLSDNIHINLDNGMIHYFTTQETTTSTPNITNALGINTSLAVGDTISVVVGITTGSYADRISIDGLLTGITTYWSGGSPPDSAGDTGRDLYTYQIIKTANATYDVIANVTNYGV